MSLAKAYVEIIPRAEGFEKNLRSEIGEDVDSAGTKIGGSFGSKLKTGLVGGLAAAGTAAVGAGSALAAATSKTAKYGDEIDKMSQKMGISSKAYQEWDFIAQHSGTTMSALKPSFKTLANAAQGGAEEFQKLGISMEDAKNMSTEDLFAATISGLQGMEEGTERTAIASKLLGRGATELGALLNTSAADTEAMRQQVNDLGGVMSDAAVKGSAAFRDSLQNLQTGFQGLTNNLTANFMPSITSIMDGLTAVMTGDSSGLGLIKHGIADFLTNMSGTLDTVFNLASEIVPMIGSAIIDNLPQLLGNGVKIVVKLATGIIQGIPKLVQKLPQIISAITKTLVNSIPQIISAGITLLGGIVKAVPSVLGSLIKAANTLVTTLWNGLKSGVSKMADAGLNLIKGLWQGIKNAGAWIWEKIKGFCSGIVDKIKGFFGIHSPSTVFAWMGEQMMLGLGKGLDSKSGFVLDTMGDITGNVLDSAAMPVLTGTYAPGQVSGDQSKTTNSILNAILYAVREGQVLVLDKDTLIAATAKDYRRALNTLEVRAGAL